MVSYRHVCNPIVSVEGSRVSECDPHPHSALYSKNSSMACEQRRFGRHVPGIAVEIKRGWGHHLKIIFCDCQLIQGGP